MDKIGYINYNTNPEQNIKKQKAKKSKTGSKEIFNQKEEDTFFDILNSTFYESINEIKDSDNISEDKIGFLLKEIGKQGERLKKSKTLEELDLYKKMIREYLNMIISHSETLEKKSLWSSKQKQKISKVHIQIINNELLELTRIFFIEQKDTFAIAAKIDKIEGLLIDLKS